MIYLVEYGEKSLDQWTIDPEQPDNLQSYSDACKVRDRLNQRAEFSAVRHRVVEYVRKEALVKEGQSRVKMEERYTVLCRTLPDLWGESGTQPKDRSRADQALAALLQARKQGRASEYKLVADVTVEDACLTEVNELRAKAEELNEKADKIMKELGK